MISPSPRDEIVISTFREFPKRGSSSESNVEPFDSLRAGSGSYCCLLPRTSRLFDARSRPRSRQFSYFILHPFAFILSKPTSTAFVRTRSRQSPPDAHESRNTNTTTAVFPTTIRRASRLFELCSGALPAAGIILKALSSFDGCLERV